MLEKPNLPDEDIIAGLRAGYDLDVRALEFLPIGYDATAWVFRVVVENDRRYFLKVKKGAIYPPALTVPHFLKARGMESVVAPLTTNSDDLWHPVNADFSLIVYPFIDAESGMAVGMTAAQWRALGTALKQIHAVTPAVSGLEAVRIETFNLNPRWLNTIQRIPATIDSGDFANPHQQQFAVFWQAKQAEITRIVDRGIQLGRWLQSQSLEKVLCHTDIHTANVLVEGTDKIHIVDWDSPLFAPRERDLMFMVEQNADDAAHFFEGYGQMPVNPLRLAYYRYEWVVQEFGDFAKRVFFMDDVGDETHADSVRGFKQLFDPSDVIAEAYKVESNLPATHRQHVWQTGIASRSGNGEGRG